MQWVSIIASFLGLASALVAAAAMAANLPEAGIYSCIDAQGRRLTADRPIAACVDREQRLLGPSGVERARLGPTLTDAERDAQAAQRRQQLQVAQRAEIKRTTDIFRGQIVDVSASVYTVQLTGTSEKLDSFIQSIGTASILETVRSGVTGIARGDKVLSI